MSIIVSIQEGMYVVLHYWVFLVIYENTQILLFIRIYISLVFETRKMVLEDSRNDRIFNFCFKVHISLNLSLISIRYKYVVVVVIFIIYYSLLPISYWSILFLQTREITLDLGKG